MTNLLLPISLAYLLGSIPFGYLLMRIFRQQDIRRVGSGNIGATNVARSGAKGLGVATLLLDIGKGYAAVLMALHLGSGASSPYDVAVGAAVAAIVGHCFPVWLKFRGGKGVATGLGVFLALAPGAALSVLLLFVLILVVTRYVSLASIVAAAMFPVFGLYFVSLRTPMIEAGFVAIPLVIIAKHHQNISRLLAGTENKFGSKKVPA